MFLIEGMNEIDLIRDFQFFSTLFLLTHIWSKYPLSIKISSRFFMARCKYSTGVMKQQVELILSTHMVRKIVPFLALFFLLNL